MIDNVFFCLKVLFNALLKHTQTVDLFLCHSLLLVGLI